MSEDVRFVNDSLSLSWYNERMSTSKAWTRLSPEVRKEQILAAALSLFIERGFEAVDVPDIAERAGVSRPTIYKYFASTDVILEQLLERALQEVWLDLVPVVERAAYIERTQAIREAFSVLIRHPVSIKLLHSGGGPIFHRYRKTFLFERLGAYLHATLPEEEQPYKHLLDSVVLENMAFWAIMEPSIDLERLSETIASTLAANASPPKPLP